VGVLCLVILEHGIANLVSETYTAISENLDILINETKEGGRIPHFAFGESTCWGVQDKGTGAHTFHNDAVPRDFISATDKIGEKGRKPTWQTWYAVDFVTFGLDDVWAFGVSGKPVWSEKLGERYPKLAKLLNVTLSTNGDVVRKVKNIELSPVSEDQYWIEYYDGKVVYNLPGEWVTEINEYAESRYRLPRLTDPDDGEDGAAAAIVGKGVVSAAGLLIGFCEIL